MSASSPGRERRASANTSGSDFTLAKGPLGREATREIAEPRRPAPNEENRFLLPDLKLWRANSLNNNNPTADLMSRRHPLASIRTLCPKSAVMIRSRPDRGDALMTCRLSREPATSVWRETYFFFATLRVFFAVFFTALFAFFTVFLAAFFAFLAMLPSNVRWLYFAVCTRGSRYTSSRIHQHEEKNSFSLKEVLTTQAASAARTSCRCTKRRSVNNARRPHLINIGKSDDFTKGLVL